MPGSITPKGTGYQDYRRRLFGTLPVSVRGGSVDISGTIEHILAIGTLNYLGTVQRVGRLGTVQRIGTIRYIQAGSIGYLGRVGSVQRVGRVGTVQNIGTVRYIQAGSIGKLNQLGTFSARFVSRKALLGTVSRHSAVGSTYVGSWENISQFQTKTYAVWSTLAGSLSVVIGAIGTGPSTGPTGTLYRVRLGAGTFQTISFSEDFNFARAVVRAGSVAPGKGTVRLSRGFKV